MRSILKWALRLIVVLALAIGAVGIWKQEEIKRLWAVRTLFIEEKIVGNFSNMGAAFLSTGVPRGDGPTVDLPYGAETELPASVDAWVKARNVTALVVLKDGQIVFEEYYQGTGADDLRISWSMAKSFLSVLVGQLIEDGTIESLDVPVTQYAPMLKGGAYDGASLRDVLQMSSGVVFDEDYLDQSSDINRMGRVLALGGKMDAFAADLTESFAAPGTQWQYVSIDTHVVGMVVRGATGRPIADLLSERVIAPLGLEHTPYYLTDGVGTAFVLGGLNLSTRDYARFGQMIAQGGHWQGRQIVSEDWIEASTMPSAPTAEGKIGYGYQWWIPVGAAEGEFMARGIYGQYIYIDRRRGVVIATNAADRKFREAGVADANIAIFREIATGL
ncbi:serine hydrolase domain-containing protein [Sulfitobacter sp. JB4-11]|uniref:serine hydrolase domain-containing protein n=1 Tax=Sulfitobacter rhodophyticola TaxID=3238304 RepID=UPI003D8152F1